MTIDFRRLHPDAQKPHPAHGYHEDAGADLVSVQDVTIAPCTLAAVDTGIAVALPPGYEAQVRSRSGMAAKHRVFVLNSPGTIDPGFRDSIKVLLYNAGTEDFVVQAGDRIAQLVVGKYSKVNWREFDTDSEWVNTKRGTNGLGSTGRRKRPAA